MKLHYAVFHNLPPLSYSAISYPHIVTKIHNTYDPIDMTVLHYSDVLLGDDLVFNALCLNRTGQPKEVEELAAWLLLLVSGFMT